MGTLGDLVASCARPVQPTLSTGLLEAPVIPRTIALLMLAAVLVACGSSTPSPTTGPAGIGAEPSASLSPSAPTSQSPSDSASVSTAPSDSPEPSVDGHGVPALEALLPTRVGAVDITRLSLTGKDFYATGTPESRSRLDAFLASLGKTVADLKVADAGDPSGRTLLDVGAFQVVGAKPADLLTQWVASAKAADPTAVSATETTIGGRAVTKLVDGTREVGATTYIYAKGDTLFLVQADDLALVTSALSQLPKP